MPIDPDTYLNNLAKTKDVDIVLAHAALALAAKHQPDINIDRYENHLKALVDEVGERHETLLKNGADDDAGAQLAALKDVLHIDHGYIGDSRTYDDLENASLIRVIERRKGLPITLCILYMHAANAQGWSVAGLNIPGHFVCRLEKDGERMIFDPFNACDVLEAPQLRLMVKKAHGEHAELSAQYFEPASNKDILIRLQNNIKFRQIEAEDYSGALKTVELMRLVDPAEYRLLLDAGVLYARTDQPKSAIEALEGYIAVAPHDQDRHEAALLLQDLRISLN